MAKKPQKNLFQKLTALFKNGPVINKKIKRVDTTVAMPDKSKSSGALLFQKSVSPTYSSITSNAYNLSERLTRYQDFCLTGDTLVALSNVSGAMRIDELVARWAAGDRDFWTFSYDEKTKSIVSSKVTGAVCNGRRSIVSVVLDDGSVIKCTPDHRFLLQDRSYVEAQNLRSGTALMRFSRADFATPYRYVQTKTRGWKPEHVLVAEAVTGRLCTSNEHVHHRNFVHRDNSPGNLEIMSSHDHMSLHAKINNLRFSDPVQRAHMSDVMKNRWSESGDLRANLSKTIEKTRESRRANRIAYNKVVKPGKFNAGRKDQIGIQNANADKLLTYQAICDAYQQNDTLASLANKLGVSTYKVRNRLLWEGYQDFGAFSSTYQNHKVVSVIDNGEFEDVYDIEVKEYNNFALAKYDEKLGAQGIVFVHNCEMEYCLHKDTKIAVPGGYKTLGELSEECAVNPEHTFIVYAYDHNKSKIVPAVGKQARLTRVDHAYTVTFDNGQKIIGTANHRLMKRDGTFCKIEDLAINDAMMPFYRRDLFNGCKEDGDGYRWIYTMDKESSFNGWTLEHRLLGEFIKGSELSVDEVVHHKNFVKHDNSLDNLCVMSANEHKRLHAEILNGSKWSEKNKEWIEQFKINHSKYMTENNPAERKDITFGRILEVSENTKFNLYRLCEALDTDPNVIKRRLRKHGYQNYETFARAYNPDWRNAAWDNQGTKNPRYVHSVTFDKICSAYTKGMSKRQLADSLSVGVTVISNRLKDRGYKNYSEFTSTYTNLKVKSIEYFGEIPLYDLTVDGYKNFATDSVISHNTAEIAAALDIYADETCSQDGKGKILHIYSDNEKIREILEDLMYNTVNVEFNLRPWTRNLVKYGDLFLYADVHPEHGVINVFPIPVNEIEREENYDKNDPFAVRFRWVSLGNRTLENWEILHFRLLGNDMFLPYGSSLIEPARRIWRQLVLIEDAMLVYRIVRAPERRVFYIDVGNLDAKDVPLYVEEQKKNLRTNQIVDRNSGRVDIRYNPLSVDEDYFLPVRGSDSGTKIDTLAGGQNTAAVEDVAYIQKKLFAALKIPRAYLGYDESLSCVVPETPVDLLDGRTLTLAQIKDELDANKQLWVYSVDQKTLEMKPGRILWCGPTRKNAELVRVTLDNGMSFDTTPDHKWMLRNGEWCEAGKLLPGVSLMPVYRRHKSLNGGSEYEQVYDPATNKWKWTHRLVVDRTTDVVEVHDSAKIEKNNVVHHRNFNRYDNDPSNLLLMGYEAHRDYHAHSLRKIKKLALLEGKYNGLNNGWARKCRSDVEHLMSIQSLVEWCRDNKPKRKRDIIAGYGLTETQLHRLLDENSLTYREFANANIVGGYKIFRSGVKHPTGRRRTTEVVSVTCPACQHVFESKNATRIYCNVKCYHQFRKLKNNKAMLNHKVVLIEFLSERRDTWCMEVADTNTFGLSKSVIISNSKATLAQEDIRFSRTIAAIQRVILSELNKLAIMHLYACGYDGEELQNFTLRLSNPSTIAQQQKLELWRTKFEIAGSVPEGVLSREFIRKEILELTDKESADIDRARLKEKYVDMTIEAGGEGGDEEGGDLEDLGGDLDLGGGGGGEGGSAPEEPEEELPPEENAGEEPEEEEQDIQLITSSDDLTADDVDIKFNAKNVNAPVNVRRHLDNVLYNRSRRRTHGASKTHMPDFGKITAIKGDDTFEDPYDHDWMKSVISNPFAESTDNTPRQPSSVGLSPDVVSALLRFREARQEQSLKQSLLREDVVQELLNDIEDE